MENYSEQQDSSLLILLGCDTLYSLDLNKLKSDGKATLELVFSHHTKQPDKSDYPLGMGLYVTHGGSKLHFFGGENLVDCEPQDKEKLRLPKVGLDNKRPDLDSLPRNKSIFDNKRINLSSEDIDRWLNKKFFSFSLNNSITPLGDHNSNQHRRLCVTPLGNTSTKLPNHFGYKVRPIVVTILGKLYVLTTRPYSTRVPANYGINGDSVLFEAFDPNDGKWEKLDNPPDDLCDAILAKGSLFNLEIVHCVHREKLLLQTSVGKFLYNASSNEWITMPKYSYPMILASLEYKNFLLAFILLDPCSDWIAVYDLETFDLETFWKESTNYISILDIEEDRRERCVSRASFSLLKDNRICVVLNNISSQLHVYLFEVIIKLTLPLHNSLHWPSTWLRQRSKCEHEQPHQKFDLSAHVLAHQMFQRPQFLRDTYIVTTFLFPESREEDSWESNRCCNGNSNTVFVRGLPSSVTTFAIQLLFNVLEFGEIKPNGVFLNKKEHFAFVEFEDVESTYKATKASPIHFAGNIVYIDKVYRTSKSLRMWLRKQKATLKEEIAQEIAVGRMEEIAVGRMEEIALS